VCPGLSQGQRAAAVPDLRPRTRGPYGTGLDRSLSSCVGRGLLFWRADSRTGAIDGASRLELKQRQPGASRHRAERTRERVQPSSRMFPAYWATFCDDGKRSPSLLYLGVDASPHREIEIGTHVVCTTILTLGAGLICHLCTRFGPPIALDRFSGQAASESAHP
jgi:hypothetical protein